MNQNGCLTAPSPHLLTGDAKLAGREPSLLAELVGTLNNTARFHATEVSSAQGAALLRVTRGARRRQLRYYWGSSVLGTKTPAYCDADKYQYEQYPDSAGGITCARPPSEPAPLPQPHPRKGRAEAREGSTALRRQLARRDWP